MALKDTSPHAPHFSRASGASPEAAPVWEKLRDTVLSLDPRKFSARWDDDHCRVEIPLRVYHAAQATKIIPLIEQNPRLREHAVFFFGKQIVPYDAVVSDLADLDFTKLAQMKEPCDHPRIYLTPPCQHLQIADLSGKAQRLSDDKSGVTYIVFTSVASATMGQRDRHFGRSMIVQQKDPVIITLGPRQENERETHIRLTGGLAMTGLYTRPEETSAPATSYIRRHDHA